MKTTLIIWLIALIAVVIVPVYIFTSIDDKLLRQDAEDSLQVMEKIETVNPQPKTIDAAELQGGN